MLYLISAFIVPSKIYAGQGSPPREGSYLRDTRQLVHINYVICTLRN